MSVDAQKPKKLLCKDWFFIGNTELYHVEVLFKRGKHEITFTNIDTNALKDIKLGGFKIYMFCDGFIDTFISAFKTVLMFVGGLGDDPNARIMNSHVPEYMVKENLQFLKDAMGYEL